MNWRDWRDRTADDVLKSLSAAKPDPHTLKAVNPIVCTSVALLNNQMPQKNTKKEDSATISAHPTRFPPYCDTFITSDLLNVNSQH